MASNVGLEDERSKKEKQPKTNNIFRIVGNDIIGWGKNIFETLFYKNNVEETVQLQQYKPKLKIKKGIEIQVGQEIKAEDLVENLPEGTTVSLIEGQNININEIGPTQVKIQITEGTKKKEKTVSIKIVKDKIETDKEKIEKVRLKKELGLGDREIEAKDLLEGLPEGGEATFKDGIGINKKDGKDQEITIIVKIGEETKEIQIIANIITVISGEQYNVAMIGEGMGEISSRKLMLKEKNDIIDKTSRYLDESIFRFQIGKMQENDETIYSEEMLRIGISYMINHTKKGKKSIIQIWSDVGILLQQGDEKGVLPPKEQQERIEEFIRKNFGKKGKCIEVIIGSEQEQYSKVFEALNKEPVGKRRFGIIPEEEPTLKDLKQHIKNVSNETALKIINYLAYHANKDNELMTLFYNTKPDSYKKKDGPEHKPGTIDADYYGIVEVGLRLTEFLRGISIQGGSGRQRFYDKIISLIINGEDRIGKSKQFGCEYTLDIKKYEALKKLHELIQESCSDNQLNRDFKQVYVESDKSGLDKVKEKKAKKHQLAKKSIKTIGYGGLIALTLGLGGGAIYTQINKQKEKDKHNTELSEFEEKTRAENTYPYHDSINEFSLKNPYQALHQTNYPNPENADYKAFNYEYKQEQILISAYDLSRFNYINHGLVDNGVEKNKIVEEFSKSFNGIYRAKGIYLSAEEFMKNYIETLSENYHLEYQKPYAHLKDSIIANNNQGKEYIINTLLHGNTIDISKHKIEEIKTKKKFTYYIENDGHDGQLYYLKFFRVYIDDKTSIDMIFASKAGYPETGYTLKNGLLCMQDLYNNYGEGLPAIETPNLQ